METVSIKLEEEFASDVESLLKKHHYSTRTEFIREAIRDKVKELEREEILGRIRKLYGASKRKTTDEALHRAGEKAFKEVEQKFS